MPRAEDQKNRYYTLIDHTLTQQFWNSGYFGSGHGCDDFAGVKYLLG